MTARYIMYIVLYYLLYSMHSASLRQTSRAHTHRYGCIAGVKNKGLSHAARSMFAQLFAPISLSAAHITVSAHTDITILWLYTACKDRRTK